MATTRDGREGTEAGGRGGKEATASGSAGREGRTHLFLHQRVPVLHLLAFESRLRVQLLQLENADAERVTDEKTEKKYVGDTNRTGSFVFSSTRSIRTRKLKKQKNARAHSKTIITTCALVKNEQRISVITSTTKTLKMITSDIASALINDVHTFNQRQSSLECIILCTSTCGTTRW